MPGFIRKIRDLILSQNRRKITAIAVAAIALITIPLTVFISQQRQDIRQRAAYVDDTISSAGDPTDEKLSQNIVNKSCGNDCDKQPPPPPGKDIITYCSNPLIVPNDKLPDEYKNYPNVQNNEGKDNRYFVYISKGNDNPNTFEIKNLNDIKIEPLTESGISFNGNTAIITDNGTFVIHGNPGSSFLVFGKKSLELNTSEKSILYPVENCAELSGSMAYAVLQESNSTGNEETNTAFLYAALLNLSNTVRTTIAHVIENTRLETPITTTEEKLLVDIMVEAGGDPMPLAYGMEYGKGGGASLIYTENDYVRSALEYARSLKDMSIEEKINAIDRWISENGVYPTEKVIQELTDPNLNFDPDTGKPNIYRDQEVARVATGLDAGTLGKEETLGNLMSTQLADDRFLCLCRDISPLTVAMSREAGVEAWLSYSSTHVFVQFKNSSGGIMVWDPTTSLAKDRIESR